MTGWLEERPAAPRTRPNVRIPMRDGVELSADLFYPESDEPAPVILKYYPYRKDDLLRGATVDNVAYYAAHGYITALLDIRGTGASAGVADRMLRLQEWEDGYDAVEWLAAQPWCDGSVGMTGVSYGGFSALLTAAQAPPHLKAIAPVYAGWDHYENSHPGGMWQTFIWSGSYNAMMSAFSAAPPAADPEGAWLEIWEEHLTNNKPWLNSWLRDQVDGPAWHEGSIRYGLENIQCATFIIGGWHDIFVSDPFYMYMGLNPDVPKKLMVGPYLHTPPNIGFPGPRVDHLHEIVRWFDQHLKGEDTGIVDEPPIAIWVRGYDQPQARRETAAGYWRSESDWPLARAESETLYLQPGGRLTDEAPEDGGGGSVSYACDPAVGVSTMGLMTGLAGDTGLPLDQRREAPGSVVFIGEPLEADLELTGFPHATLYVSSTAEVTAFSVKLVDVHPDGPWALVSRVIKNATQRNSRTDPAPLVPGEVIELNIELEPVSYVFGAGHRLGIMVASSDFPLVWPLPEHATNTVHMDRDHPSRVTLPVVSRHDSGLPAPDYRPAPPLPEASGTTEPLRWELVESLSGTEVSVVISWGSDAIQDNGARICWHVDFRATTDRAKPAESSIEAAFRFDVDHGASTTEVRTTSRVAGNSDAFHGVTAVEVRTDGMPCFSRTWHCSVPRGFL